MDSLNNEDREALARAYLVEKDGPWNWWMARIHPSKLPNRSYLLEVLARDRSGKEHKYYAFIKVKVE